MASLTDVFNRSLQKLGVKRLTSYDENSPAGRACRAAWRQVRRAELRKNTWTFATRRFELAADDPNPTWGRQNSFTLPADFIKLVPLYPEIDTPYRDWVLENKKILTNDSAPLYGRYVADTEVINEMDDLFIESTACKMAYEMCEELTQSNSKKESLKLDYRDAIREAKRCNAIENVPQTAVQDEWEAVRSQL